jgi:serine/threonine protein phosphatase 1
MFGLGNKDKKRAELSRGYRAYAVGDVHGRLDLLDALLAAIERDDSRRAPRKTALIFLGDLIDRGPDSRGVIERLDAFRHPRIKPVFLLGNHEEVLLRLLSGERGILDSWLKFGGAECIRSYGLDPSSLSGRSERTALDMIRDAIPSAHRRFIESFADTLKLGDYLFVHAGIRPNVDLSLQAQKDLRWIRAPFLDDDTDHGFTVVHGHTIRDSVDIRSNRIGLDTGAYMSGILSAVGLEGQDSWILDTASPVGTNCPAIDLNSSQG